MGNCQAIDTATLVIQHPSGKSDKLCWSVSAAEVMKSNPGHYVALLISSTLCPPPPQPPPGGASSATTSHLTPPENHVRVTRIKLLKPTDFLVLGQVYRLITSKEVMKVLSAKKHAKMIKNGHEIRVEHHHHHHHLQQQQEATSSRRRRMPNLPDVSCKDNLVDKHERVEEDNEGEGQIKPPTAGNNNSATGGRSKSWQPSLKSISEASS